MLGSLKTKLKALSSLSSAFHLLPSLSTIHSPYYQVPQGHEHWLPHPITSLTSLQLYWASCCFLNVHTHQTLCTCGSLCPKCISLNICMVSPLLKNQVSFSVTP